MVGASNGYLLSTPTYDSAYFLYNMSTQSFTSLGNLMLCDDQPSTVDYNGGHEQAINNAGQVVGYEVVERRQPRRNLAKRHDHGPEYAVQ